MESICNAKILILKLFVLFYVFAHFYVEAQIFDYGLYRNSLYGNGAAYGAPHGAYNPLHSAIVGALPSSGGLSAFQQYMALPPYYGGSAISGMNGLSSAYNYYNNGYGDGGLYDNDANSLFSSTNPIPPLFGYSQMTSQLLPGNPQFSRNIDDSGSSLNSFLDGLFNRGGGHRNRPIASVKPHSPLSFLNYGSAGLPTPPPQFDSFLSPSSFQQQSDAMSNSLMNMMMNGGEATQTSDVLKLPKLYGIHNRPPSSVYE